jgi:hypothetical protein
MQDPAGARTANGSPVQNKAVSEHHFVLMRLRQEMIQERQNRISSDQAGRDIVGWPSTASMKRIRHTVFTKSVRYPLWGWKAGPRRQKERERLRERAEGFIGEIGAANLVSLIEYEQSVGQFSMVVWWVEEAPEGEELVIRAVDESHA